MEANEEKTHEKRIVRIKQNFIFNYIFDLLLLMRGGEAMRDQHFRELHKQLLDYVDSQLAVPDGLDIIDEYYLLECEVYDEEQYEKSCHSEGAERPKNPTG